MRPRLPLASGDIRPLLDVLFIASLLIFLANTLLVDPVRELWTTLELVVLYGTRLCCAVLIGLLWLRVRSRERLAWLVAFCILAWAATWMSEPSFLLVAIIVVFVRLGERAGYILVAVVVATGIILLGMGGTIPLSELVAMILFDLLLLATPTLVGVALSRLQRNSELAEVANQRLAAANRELQQRTALEHDLALAAERAHTARELHDGLGHRLTVAGMSLDYVERLGPQEAQAAREEIAQARELVEQALADVATWTRQATLPAVETGAGLAALVEGFRATGAKISVDIDEVLVEAPHLEVFVTRFVQEGMTNALRHAAADNIRLRCRADSGDLVIELRNDGSLATEPVVGFGLRSLRERAHALGGEFEARSGRDEFVISARLPLPLGERVDEVVRA